MEEELLEEKLIIPADEALEKNEDLNDERTAEEDEEQEISFEDLGLDEITLAAIKRKKFEHPSPIQVLAIPRLLNGEENVVARARTGTGKTAAFGLPLVQTLREDLGHVRAIILEPTRELAMQTANEMSSFATGKFPRSLVVYGGSSYSEQIRALKKGVEIVVGTPGRVQDLIDRKALDISQIEYFILDEGDEMLDMGFVDDIENIFSCANTTCRVLLFSATIPAPILKIAGKFMGDYEIVEEEGHEEEPLLIKQEYWVVKESEKNEALIRLIDYSPDFYGLVFVQKKSDADYLSKFLDEKGYKVGALHGDIPQGQREKILAGFRAKRTRILVATDVAARGIDIEGLTHVVNYELPFDGPTYVHRIGRTGRAGAAGMAVTLVRPEETRRKLRFLCTAIKKSAKGEMVQGQVPGVDEVIAAKKERLFDEVKQKLQNQSEKESDAQTQEEGAEKEVTIFDALAQELCQDKDPRQVLASLLEATYGNELSKSRYGKINQSASKSRDRFSTVAQNQIRLYVQMGWNDGYTPKKIADYFTKLLHVRSRDVDAIDMADNFCLLSLPKAAGEKALEISNRDKSVPHMHVDSKSVMANDDDESYSRKKRGRGEGSRGSSRGSSRGGSDRYAVAKKDERKRGGDSPKGSRSKGKETKHGRANVHNATQRSTRGSAALYKKGGSEEY
ncbi:MAG: DEAD/DEAH box helicase [Treponema sp.]|nr:DEAD/DEAH box helicase [Treponema sp.]